MSLQKTKAKYAASARQYTAACRVALVPRVAIHECQKAEHGVRYTDW